MGRGNEVTVTNDGATILKAIYVDNPAAKVLVGGWARPLWAGWPRGGVAAGQGGRGAAARWAQGG